MKLGFIGLGKMGGKMAGKLLREGHELVVWNRSSEPVQELKSQISNLKSTSQNLKTVKSIEVLVKGLEKPRIVWVMVTAGFAMQTIFDELVKFAEQEDIIIDGGNSYYKDTQTRFELARQRGIRYLGIGVSGGVIAATDGYPMMAGGDKSGYDYIVPILESLSKPSGGHEYFGTGGAGHFVKMVHNGIEYGVMQSIGEGFGVLEKSPYNLDLLKIAKLYQKGTLVSGFMMERTAEVLEKDPKLSNILGVVAESGEAKWTVQQAREEGVNVEIIERSLEFRKRSQEDSIVQNSFSAKLVAGLRNAFGGHEVKRKR